LENQKIQTPLGIFEISPEDYSRIFYVQSLIIVFKVSNIVSSEITYQRLVNVIISPVEVTQKFLVSSLGNWK